MPETAHPAGFADERLRAALAAAGASGTWDWDIASGLLFFDEKFAELYGFDVEAGQAGVPTAMFFSAMHPEDRPRMKIAVAGILGGAELFSKEFRIQRRDGAIVWMHGRGHSHLNPAEQPVRFTGILVDVTERKRTEERLRIAQSAGGIGTFEYVEGFSTALVSTDFCRLLGLHPARVLPIRTINGVVPAGEAPIIPVGDPNDNWTAQTLAGEFRIKRPDDGAQRWIARRGEIIRDSEISSFRFIGVIYDVTAAKAAEDRLRELNETLETRVQAETAERMQAENALRQAQKMEAVGLLTGGVAHDFNNLLMAILGSLNLVRKRLSFDPRITPLVENAIQGAERGASLTQRMLAFARRQELDVKPVDIALLVNGMTDLMQRSLGPSYSVEIDVPSSLPPAFTDSNQLAAAILNLAVNARDAMPHGGSIRIRGRRSTVEAPGNGPLVAGTYVRLAVIDEGEGMDAETLARATEPFFTTKGVGKGTGLGLSMVHGVAAQSGGQLLLKSVPHEGTTVEIWLPVATVADDASSPTPITDALASTSDLDCPRAILVVDDDALVRMNMVVMLEDLGHRVSEAASARLALEILERGEAFDLVITDHAMPGVTGADLADQIQARWPRLPVVLATGYAELPPGVRTGRPRLTKPFSQDELGGIVKSVLSEAFNQESD